jgi:multiple sugar transport system permease protein
MNNPILRPRPARSGLVRALARHAAIISVLFIMLYPLVWMLAASFRPNNQVFNRLGLFNSEYTLENYSFGWSSKQLHFSQYFVNSLTLSVLAVAGNILACTLAAYAFARLDFRFKRPLFALLLGTMLLPYHVTLVPQYVLFSQLDWINTFLPLIVPRYLAVDAFFVFLMVQFIRTLPRELDDAARIDGCGHWRIFTRIIVPLAVPAIATTALFTFINAWNDFLGPLLYLNKPELWVVPQGLGSFLDATGQGSYGGLFAMSVLSLAPIIGFFLAAQRLLIEGIATTGLK